MVVFYGLVSRNKKEMYKKYNMLKLVNNEDE